MREVTVRVPLDESRDLLERPARACVGFARGGRPQLEPVRLRFDDGRFLVGFDPAAILPDPSAEVVMVVDEGVLFFELRAVYVRGRAHPVDSPELEKIIWFEVEQIRVSSWNYGRMRWQRGTE